LARVAKRLALDARSSLKKILVAALCMAVPSLTCAQGAGDIDYDCSDYYGFNICGTSFEASDNQTELVEQNAGTLTPLFEARDPKLSTSLSDDDMQEIDRKDAFKNSDSFRAYMKTLGSTGSTNPNSEFSVTKRILQNKNIGLDCRLVTSSIYELSSSNYYDCALQRYF
jgi:hypothetical protein